MEMVVCSVGSVWAGIIAMEGGDEESTCNSSICGRILLRGGKAGFGERGGASSMKQNKINE